MNFVRRLFLVTKQVSKRNNHEFNQIRVISSYFFVDSNNFSNSLVNRIKIKKISQHNTFKRLLYSEEIVNGVRIVNYEEIKDLPNHPEKLLIDVREPEEVEELGKIPTSINISLGQVEKALKLSEDDFKNLYGRKKPALNDYIIFHCRSGKRSQKAAEIAVKLGYTAVNNYLGSWLEWAEKEGLPQ